MLIKYNVSNYKSIGHDIEFSMLPVREDVDERFVQVLHTKSGDLKVLHRGAFYGPNASGKTSFIESIAYANGCLMN